MRAIRILTVLFLIITLDCLGQQEEYIVTNSNDTIFGKISRSINYLNSAEVRFKIKDNNGNKSLIDPGEIKFLKSIDGVDGDCTIATIYDKWFIKRILDGKIKVYQLVDGLLFFTSKNNSEIISNDFGGLNNRVNSLNRIRPLIEDNPIILEEFNSISGSQKDILYILEKYNNQSK